MVFTWNLYISTWESIYNKCGNNKKLLFLIAM